LARASNLKNTTNSLTRAYLPLPLLWNTPHTHAWPCSFYSQSTQS